MFLNSGTRTLVQHSVNVNIHASPSLSNVPSKTSWDEAELREEAEKVILRDLKATLEKDIIDRVVGLELRRMVAEEKSRQRTESGTIVELQENEPGEKLHVATNLKGLSFRKEKKRVHDEVKPSVDDRPVLLAVCKAGVENEERPKKKSKKAAKQVLDEDIESEDDLAAPPRVSAVDDVPGRKRAASILSEVDEPVRKKSKPQLSLDGEVDASLVVPEKKAKKTTKKTEPDAVHEIIHEVLQNEFDIPAITQLDLSAESESSLSLPSSPILAPKPILARTPSPSPAINLLEHGICDDDEDLYYAKLTLSGCPPSPTPRPQSLLQGFEPSLNLPPPFRVHVTGSARTEGYYKISHAEKAAYVAQYANRTTVADIAVEEEAPQPQNVASSRSNRANARRRAQGLEEINQVQRAMALSKGESAATELVKFNQLQIRKKHLRFARSPIHDWGLYAMEKISRGEMVIEYVGEVIRAQVADKREKAYERQGIGSSYLFRIDEDLVVDATKKGNLG